jgi:hypothetical protein
MSGVTSWAERPGRCTIHTSQRDRFYRGRTSGALQIDQPLSYAWQMAVLAGATVGRRESGCAVGIVRQFVDQAPLKPVAEAVV